MGKPKLQLSGQDGNVFFILGSAQKVARKAGWTKEKIEQFMKEAMSGDYDRALQTCIEYFDVQ